MPLLLCEGGCNPDLAACDVEVRIERKRSAFADHGTISAVSEGLVSRLRRLVHTAHQAIGDVHAQCLICGTTRRYGKTL